MLLKLGVGATDFALGETPVSDSGLAALWASMPAWTAFGSDHQAKLASFSPSVSPFREVRFEVQCWSWWQQSAFAVLNAGFAAHKGRDSDLATFMGKARIEQVNRLGLDLFTFEKGHVL